MSKRLVIDASIARAAGETEHPTSKRCRDFLRAVLRICHRLVLTPEIQEEWRRHQSDFTRKWRVQMYARKKIDEPNPPLNEPLRTGIERTTTAVNEQEAMLKDMRLIEAALNTDKVVVSLDERARTLFDRAGQTVEELRLILWLNPERPEESPLAWLEAGAKIERERQLGN